MLISMKKHAAMVNTNSATKSSSFLTYINVQNKGYMSVHMHEKLFYKWSIISIMQSPALEVVYGEFGFIASDFLVWIGEWDA